MNAGDTVQVVIRNAGINEATYASDNMGIDAFTIPGRSVASFEWQAPAGTDESQPLLHRLQAFGRILHDQGKPGQPVCRVERLGGQAQETEGMTTAHWEPKGQPAIAVAAIVFALLIASTWLVFPYFVRDMDLIQNVGADVKAERLQNSITIGKFLNRTTFGVGEAQVDVLYATPKFFRSYGSCTDGQRIPAGSLSCVHRYRDDPHRGPAGGVT